MGPGIREEEYPFAFCLHGGSLQKEASSVHEICKGKGMVM